MEASRVPPPKKKSRPLSRRAYNVLFHTHTVSGVTLSAALFVIFYAGAFALFRDELFRWEDPAARHIDVPAAEVSLEEVFAKALRAYPDFVAAEQTTVRLPTRTRPHVDFYGARAAAGEGGRPRRFHVQLDPSDGLAVHEHERARTTLSDTLYHLHYLGQLPAGKYLSGLVALFFLFAVASGVLIHWHNLWRKALAFVTEGSWKSIWTNAHTVLGVIGVPFQVMYAVTGAFFGLLTLLLIPSAFVLFGGDTGAVQRAVAPGRAMEVDAAAPVVAAQALDAFAKTALAELGADDLKFVRVANYGRADAKAVFHVDDDAALDGGGAIAYDLATGKELHRTQPRANTYTQGALAVMTKLHFGSFGGLGIRVAYFLFAMLTCVMLVAGIMLWYEARDKPGSYTPAQLRFHRRVTRVNLAVCLGLVAAVPVIFLANKLVPYAWEARTLWVDAIFFGGWALIGLGISRAVDFRGLLRASLWATAVAGALVPLANGAVTGDWLWRTIAAGRPLLYGVDVFWVAVALSSGAVAYLLRRASSSHPPNTPRQSTTHGSTATQTTKNQNMLAG